MGKIGWFFKMINTCNLLRGRINTVLPNQTRFHTSVIYVLRTQTGQIYYSLYLNMLCLQICLLFFKIQIILTTLDKWVLEKENTETKFRSTLANSKLIKILWLSPGRQAKPSKVYQWCLQKVPLLLECISRVFLEGPSLTVREWGLRQMCPSFRNCFCRIV